MATFVRVPHPIARRSGAVFRRTPEVDRHVQPAAAVVAPLVRWSFADISVTAPAPVGSTALDTDEQEGFIGQTDEPEAMDVPTPSSKKSPAPVPKAPPSGTPPTPGTPPAPTISSATVKTAPSGAANTRTDVGVGEVVDFTGSVAGTWTATGGTATGASSTKFRWTAPATAGSVTITLKAGAASATDTINVVAPKNISMKNVGSHTAQVGPGGACMLTEVTFKPLDVCLGSIQWLEVPGPATGFVGDYFKKFSAATLRHKPNKNYAVVDDNNVMEAGPKNAANDHCAVHTLPGPYKAGEFEWRIPNRYKLDSEADGKGRWFTDTTQHFAMTAAGDLTITKAGATT